MINFKIHVLFKIIESDQWANLICDSIDSLKNQYLNYHQLFAKIISCINKRPDVDNLLVTVICYAKYRLPITDLINAIIQLLIIITFIHNKNNSKTKKLSLHWTNNVLLQKYIITKGKITINFLKIRFKMVD